ncbi:MAG: ABC transporter substrate-binding protein [Deltaproteobacteria bacterium]|nr:ABC transporter substrate-binding protein [Deltaproteobacteria bacterium]
MLIKLKLIILTFICAVCLSDSVVKVGVILPLTGLASRVGQVTLEGIKVFEKHYMDSNKLAFKFIVEDTGSINSRAVQAFKKLTEVDQVRIILTAFGAHGMTLKPMAEAKNVLLWSFTIHPEQSTGTKFVFRHNMSIDGDVNNIERFLRDRKVKNVACLYSNEDIGVYYDKKLTALAEKLSVRYFSESVLVSETNFRTTISKLLSQKPDMLFIYLFGPNLGIAIKQARESGYSELILVGPQLSITPEARAAAGDSLKDVWFTDIIAPDSCIEKLKLLGTQFISPASCFPIISLELLTHSIIENRIDFSNSSDILRLASYIRNLKQFRGSFQTVKITGDGEIIAPSVIKKALN